MEKVYGYIRAANEVQSGDYSLEQQIGEIMSKYDNCIMIEEQLIRKTINRPKLAELKESLNKGDVLVVTKLDILVISLKTGIDLIEELFQRGIIIDILNIGVLEDIKIKNFFIQTLLSVFEMQQVIIRERARDGKVMAQNKPGFKEGRPKVYSKKEIDYALSLLTVNGGTMSYSNVVSMTNISKSTLIRENNMRKVE